MSISWSDEDVDIIGEIDHSNDWLLEDPSFSTDEDEPPRRRIRLFSSSRIDSDPDNSLIDFNFDNSSPVSSFHFSDSPSPVASLHSPGLNSNSNLENDEEGENIDENEQRENENLFQNANHDEEEAQPNGSEAETSNSSSISVGVGVNDDGGGNSMSSFLSRLHSPTMSFNSSPPNSPFSFTTVSYNGSGGHGSEVSFGGVDSSPSSLSTLSSPLRDFESFQSDSSPHFNFSSEMPGEKNSTPLNFSDESNPSSKPKAATNDSSKNTDETDPNGCLVCLESLTDSGNHRAVCLKCGHIFGKECIEKWLVSTKRCPSCNHPARKEDLRVIYCTSLKLLATSERDELKNENKKLKEYARKKDMEITNLSQSLASEKEARKRLLQECQELKTKVGFSSTSVEFFPRSSSTSGMPKTVHTKKFNFSQKFEFQTSDCRVGAYDSWYSMIAVSTATKSPLYTSGVYHGVKTINLSMLANSNKIHQSVPLHTKEIRDMEFSPTQNGVLLSVGLDKKAILTSLNSRSTVQVFTGEQALWSCAWKAGGHVFYGGTTNGRVMVYDIRKPSSFVEEIIVSEGDTVPVANIKYIPPSPIGSTNSNNPSGLFVQKLNSCWFVNLNADRDSEKYNQLPFEGSFLSIDFNIDSRNMLLSTRQRANCLSRHYVFKLEQKYSEVREKNYYTTKSIQTFEGYENSAKMSRTCLFSDMLESAELVGGKGREDNMCSFWNVNRGEESERVRTQTPVIDFIKCGLNEKTILTLVHEKGLSLWNYC